MKLIQVEEQFIKAYEANMDKYQKMLIAVRHDKMAGIERRNLDQIGKVNEENSRAVCKE